MKFGTSVETAVTYSSIDTLNAEEANTATLKIKDEDSGEMVEYEECLSCGGMGGYDASRDCEEYDDWHDCEECEGRGYVELGGNDKDRFVPERDAFMPGD